MKIVPWLFVFQFVLPLAARGETLARFLPGTAYYSAETNDLAAFDAAWKKTNSYKLYKEPAMKPFWDDVEAKRPGIMPHGWLGLPWNDMLALGAKEVLWGTLPSTEGVKVATAMILQPGSERATKAKAAFEITWKDRGAKLGTLKIGDAEVITATSASRKSYFYAGPQAIVLCDKKDALEALIKQQAAGAKGPFAENKDFKVTQGVAAVDSHLFWHVRPFEYWDAIHQDDSEASQKARDQVKFYRRQGFDVITGLGGGIVYGTKNGEAEHTIRLVRNGPLTKGAGMLSVLESANFPVPKWLPQSISSITAFHWNVSQVIPAYAHVYDETYGDGHKGVFDETLKDIKDDPDGPQVDLRVDLLQKLGPLFIVARDWGGATEEKGPTGKPLKKRRTVWIAPTSNAKKSADALYKYYDGDEDFKHIDLDVGGEKVVVWTSSDPEVLMLGGEGPKGESRHLTPEVAALCVARGYVLASSDLEYLLDLLKDKGTSPITPVTHKFFADAMKSQNGRYWRNTAVDAEPVFERVQTNQLRDDDSLEQQILHRLLISNRTDDPTWKPVDGKKLPAYEAVRKHFGLLRGTIYPEANGWSIRLISDYASPQ